MILNFLTRIIDEKERNNYDLEQTFFNVTHIQESPLELIVYLQRPDGTLDSLSFYKHNGNHHNMRLLNDNFKPLKQFDLGHLSFNDMPFVPSAVNNEETSIEAAEISGMEPIIDSDGEDESGVDESNVENPEQFF